MGTTEGARLAETTLSTPERITSWLETLRETRETHDEEHSRSDQERPTTPHQRHTYEEELSPAETSFSSIFSSPKSRDDDYSPLSPCHQRSHSAPSASSATTIGEDIPDHCSDTAEKTPRLSEQAHEFDTISLTSVEPPSDYDEGEDSAQVLPDFDTVAPLPDSGGPRVVFITSCLQCTLAKLPCSRTLPACSRCVRAGHENLCLLHRRKVNEELIPGGSDSNQIPQLLKVKGESEETWEQKQALCDELLQSWIEVEDKRNWILPDLQTDRRGTYGTYGKNRVFRTHPGEGLGRQTFRSLELA